MAVSQTSDVEPYVRLIDSVLDEFGAKVWGTSPERSLKTVIRRRILRTGEPNEAPKKPVYKIKQLTQWPWSRLQVRSKYSFRTRSGVGRMGTDVFDIWAVSRKPGNGGYIIAPEWAGAGSKPYYTGSCVVGLYEKREKIVDVKDDPSILILYVCSHERLVPAEEGALRAALEVVHQEVGYI